MGLLRRLQYRLLKRDLKKGRADVYLAKKYPMSILVETNVFMRYNNSELYCPVVSKELYDAKGECLGVLCFNKLEEGNYFIVCKSDGKFGNVKDTLSFAVYDSKGKCAVPHNCYSEMFTAKDYAILSLPMDTKYSKGRAFRKEKHQDEEIVMQSTGKSLHDTLGGSYFEPRALIVSKDRIINTEYLSVEPINVDKYDVDELDNNTVWIAQTQDANAVSFKIDKKLRLTETFVLPYYANENEIFFVEEDKNAIYFLNTNTATRVNLRTGEQVDLSNLKRQKLSKKERFAQFEQRASKSSDEVLAFDDTVISLPKSATFEEGSEIPPVTEEEIGEYNPSVD